MKEVVVATTAPPQELPAQRRLREASEQMLAAAAARDRRGLEAGIEDMQRLWVAASRAMHEQSRRVPPQHSAPRDGRTAETPEWQAYRERCEHWASFMEEMRRVYERGCFVLSELG